jgi:hypothetical protein
MFHIVLPFLNTVIFNSKLLNYQRVTLNPTNCCWSSFTSYFCSRFNVSFQKCIWTINANQRENMNKIWTVYQQSCHLVITHSKVKKYVFNKNIIEISNCGNFLMSICLNMTSINSFHVITPLLSYWHCFLFRYDLHIIDIIPWGNVST